MSLQLSDAKAPVDAARVAQTAELAVNRSLFSLYKNQPFFAQILFYLGKPKAVWNLDPPTLATDGKSLFYHPGFVKHTYTEKGEAEGLKRVSMLLIHEAMHIIGRHGGRLGHRDHAGFNRAADHEINLNIKKTLRFDFNAEMHGLCDDAFAGMSAESIYNKLLKDDGEGNGGKVVFRDQVVVPDNHKDEAQRAMDEEQWKQRIAAAATFAKQQGKLPAGMEEWVNDLLRPKEHPRGVLMRFLTEASKADYSWMPANRRYVPHGIMLPSLRTQGGLVVVAVDSSGSMWGPPLKLCLGWIQEALETMQNLDVVMIQCDARVEDVRLFKSGQRLKEDGEDWLDGKNKFAVRGGGGTAFGPVFEYALGALQEEHGVPVKGVVFLTDTFGDFGTKDEPCPTVWVSTTKDPKVPWGEVAYVEAEGD